jgi:uncharacterized protein (DUF885 family)
LSLVTVLAACSPSAAAGDLRAQAPQADKAAQLNQLYADYWEGVLKLNPLQATFQGDNRYNDQLPDFGSAEFRKQSRDFTQEWLDKVEKIGDAGLAGQDLLSYRIFVEEQKQSLEGEKFPGWMMPVNQMGSTVSYAVMLGSGQVAQPFKTVKDYDNWLARAAHPGAAGDRERQHARRHEGRRGAAARADGKGGAAVRRHHHRQGRGQPVLGPDQADAGRLLAGRQGPLTEAFRTLINDS